MIRHYRSLSQFLRKQATDRFRGRPRRGGIGIIGGADGPTAVFVASKKRPKWDNGCLLIRPSLPAVLRALGVSALLVTVAVSIFEHLRGKG